MIIEIKKTTVNCGNVEVKDLKELDSLYSEGAIDDDSFVGGIQFLIEEGIMSISS